MEHHGFQPAVLAFVLDTFWGGKRRQESDCPSYIPTIFPTNHSKPALASDTERFNRRLKHKAFMPEEKIVANQDISSKTDFCILECTVPLFAFSRESPNEASSQCCLPLVQVQERSVQTSKCFWKNWVIKAKSCMVWL